MINLNKLFLISGHSGSGKTTIMRNIMANEIVSFTTRDKRAGEVDGYDYNFITLDKFKELEKNNKLIESVQYDGNHYGIDQDELLYKLSLGNAYCIVDVNGMRQLRKSYSNCVTIFLYTGYDQAFDQMKARGDDNAKIEKRLVTYFDELDNGKNYEYVVRNNSNQIYHTMRILDNIIQSEISTT